MIKAICLDMGDTLVDHHPPSHEVLGAFLAKKGIHVDEARIQRAYLAATSWYFLETTARPMQARTRAERQALVDEYDRRLIASMGLAERSDVGPVDVQAAFAQVHRSDVLFPDVLPALTALRARGLRLAIVSNWDSSLVECCVRLGLAEHLDAVVGSAAVGVEKPDPAIFACALGRLGLRPDEALHVGDLYFTDVIGARSAGVTPVLLDRYDLQPEVDCLRVRGLRELVDLVDAVAAVP